jgi:hypothetical protein
MPVNSLYYSPQINFPDRPIITLQSGDNVQMAFTPLSNFASCSILRIWRNIASPIQATLTQTSTYYQFTLPSTNTPNTDYTNTLTLSLNCASLTITDS